MVINMKNNKGFTLVELIATILVLGIVASIGGIAITKTISSSKQKNYDLLINNIVHASELYYQECKYMNTSSMMCSGENIFISHLVEYGFLKSNSENNDNIVKNPKTNEDISNCKINISYNSDLGIVKVTNASTASCPEEYN